MLNELLDAGAEGFVRSAMTSYFNDQVKAGKLTQIDESYILEGAIRALDFGLKQWQLSSKK